jgi:uncharacterized protein (DUF2141 family)
VEPGGLWDSDAMEIHAWVSKDGKRVDDVALSYAGQPSQFQATLKGLGPGTYDVTVYAYDPRNGNTGLDRTTFMVR